MQEGGDRKKPNPVVQRVKIIMALGLIVVHVHSQFLSQVTGVSLTLSTSPALLDSEGNDKETEHVPLQDYLWWKMFHLSTDQLVTIGLGLLLLLKYTFYDKTTVRQSTSCLSTERNTTTIPSPIQYPVIDGDITTAYFRKRSITINPVPTALSHEAKSQVADHKESGVKVSVDQELDRPTDMISVAVQTEELRPKFSLTSISDVESDEEGLQVSADIDFPRPVDVCVEILKSEVSNSTRPDVYALVVY